MTSIGGGGCEGNSKNKMKIVSIHSTAVSTIHLVSNIVVLIGVECFHVQKFQHEVSSLLTGGTSLEVGPRGMGHGFEKLLLSK